MKNLFQLIVLRLVDWLTRPRNLGLKLVTAGGTILVVTLGLDFLGEGEYQDGERRIFFKLSTSGGLPEWATLVAYGIAVLLLAVGLGLVIYSFVVEARQSTRKRAIVVELRGLHSSPDTPAKDANLGDFPRLREGLRLEFRPRSEAEQVDPALALQKISSMKTSIQTLADGRDPSDVVVAVGGLAAVPALFLAGLLLDDESAITIFDWERNTRQWRLIDGSDDGKRLVPADLTSLPDGAREVVLAVSISYLVNVAAVRATFSKLPIIELQAEEIAADRFWSIDKQQAIVAGFRETVQELLHKGVDRVHLVLAAPASLSLRLGMAYDRRLLPELWVYQYERSATPAYPWAFVMPTHGKAEAKLVMHSV